MANVDPFVARLPAAEALPPGCSSCCCPHRPAAQHIRQADRQPSGAKSANKRPLRSDAIGDLRARVRPPSPAPIGVAPPSIPLFRTNPFRSS
jgi:hypothetical protein